MGKSCLHWLCFPFLRLTDGFRRCPLLKRSLIIASVCVAYLFFALVGYSQQHRDNRTDRHDYRHTRGFHNLDNVLPNSVDLQIGARFVVPTRSNVVYITLRSKRLKPANIRGTIRPKLRRKARRAKLTKSAFTQNKLGTLEKDTSQIERNVARKSLWRTNGDSDHKSLNIIHDAHFDARAEPHISSIRIYSQRAPPWFSPRDVEAMRFLADVRVLRIKQVSGGFSPSLLIFEGETTGSTSNQKHTELSSLCGGECGVISSPLDNTEVFAFHLDRVLGLNRTLPAVARKFSFLHGMSTDTRTNLYLAFKPII